MAKLLIGKKYPDKTGRLYEVMSFAAAKKLGLFADFRSEDPDSVCYIIYCHTSKRDVYFGNKNGALQAMGVIVNS